MANKRTTRTTAAKSAERHAGISSGANKSTNGLEMAEEPPAMTPV
jgi:hypothetical protein